MPCRGMCHVKPKLYDALKTSEERLQAAFPGIGCSLTDPFGGSDIGVELILPCTSAISQARMWRCRWERRSGTIGYVSGRKSSSWSCSRFQGQVSGKVARGRPVSSIASLRASV